jgi:hypothetical protein
MQGYSGEAPLLSPPDANVKLHKSARPTYGLTLAPADGTHYADDRVIMPRDGLCTYDAVGRCTDPEHSTIDACVWSTPACRAACVLVTSGNNVRPSVRKAHAVRTLFLFLFPQAFVTLLWHELEHAARKYDGGIVARLNVASDIRWELVAPEVLELAGVAYYDYTKAPIGQRSAPADYRLVYSVSERPSSERNALEAMRQLATSAVVFERTDAGLPSTWHGFRVVDGDVSDDRTLDPRGTVVGLLAKGSARHVAGDVHGFVKPAIAS